MRFERFALTCSEALVKLGIGFTGFSQPKTPGTIKMPLGRKQCMTLQPGLGPPVCGRPFILMDVHLAMTLSSLQFGREWVGAGCLLSGSGLLVFYKAQRNGSRNRQGNVQGCHADLNMADFLNDHGYFLLAVCPWWHSICYNPHLLHATTGQSHGGPTTQKCFDYESVSLLTNSLPHHLFFYFW